VQNANNEGPYFAMVCRLHKCQVVNPEPNSITMKKLPCVAAELYCCMNHSSDFSLDSATAMSIWGSGTRSHFSPLFQQVDPAETDHMLDPK